MLVSSILTSNTKFMNDYLELIKNKKVRDLVDIKCLGCEVVFQCTVRHIKTKIKRGLNTLYCSNNCFNNFTRLKPKECKNCTLTFQPIRSEQEYCSQSCAAITNNKKFVKRKKLVDKDICICGSKKSRYGNVCQKCINKINFDNYSNKMLSDFISKNTASRAKYNQVRFYARKSMNIWNIPKECKICGFNEYVEVCHIKPIGSFSEDTLMLEVNSKENLVYLCPNHHKLLDIGKLTIS